MAGVSARSSSSRIRPAGVGASGSVETAIVELPMHVQVCYQAVCGDGLLVQRVGGLENTAKKKTFSICCLQL